MADEAVVTDLLGNGGDVVEYTIATSNGIPKGSLLKLNDLRTVTTVGATDVPLAGIAASEHTAGSEDNRIGVYTNVIAKMKHSGAGITVGGQVVASADGNTVKAFDTLDDETGDVLGYAMETVSDGETFLVRVQK